MLPDKTIWNGAATAGCHSLARFADAIGGIGAAEADTVGVDDAAIEKRDDNPAFMPGLYFGSLELLVAGV
jgi:hypothetical protein